jgi:hypothetical protein
MEGIRMVAYFPGNDTCVKSFNDILLKQVIAVSKEEGISLVAEAKEVSQLDPKSDLGINCAYEVTSSFEGRGDFKHACATLIDKMVDILGHHHIKFFFYETESHQSK